MCYQPCKNAGKRDMLLAANETISSFLFLLTFPQSLTNTPVAFSQGLFSNLFLWSNLFGVAAALQPLLRPLLTP